MRLVRSTQFEKDYEAIQKRGKDISKLDNIIRSLGAGNNNFSGMYKVYPFSSPRWMKDYFTLYIEPDWALIYKIDTKKDVVLLARTGHPKDI